MVPEERRRRIARLVLESGSVSISSLEEEFGISAMTARRDLDALEEEGRVQRTHGGAVAPGFARHEDSFQQRLAEAVEGKGRIAGAVAGLLGEDETVFVDSSTTAYYAARRVLSGSTSVTCLTNLVPVMDLFSAAGNPGAGLIGLGGLFRPLTLSFVGPATVRMIEAHFADRALIGVKGITSSGYLTDVNPLEAEVKRAMIRQSERPLLLVDGRKFDQRGFTVIAHVSEVSLVLAADAREEAVEALGEHGVEVRSV